MSKLILIYEKNIETKIFQSMFMNFKFLIKLARDFSRLKEKEFVLKIHLENNHFKIIQNDLDIKNLTKNFAENEDIKIEIVKKENYKTPGLEKSFKNDIKTPLLQKNSMEIVEDDKNIEKIINDEIFDLKGKNKSLNEVLKTFERLTITGIDKKSKKIKKTKQKEDIKIKRKLSLIKNELKQFDIKINPSINFGSTNFKFKAKDKKFNSNTKDKKNNDFNNKITIHEKVSCNSCQILPIIGKRYKCMICFNFDLCEGCESILYHSHPMVRLVEKMDRNFSNYINNLDLEREIKKENKIINVNLQEEKRELLDFIYGNLSFDEKQDLIMKYPDTNIEEFYKALAKI